MSRNIRLFPTYSQKENQTTNHCLLILKMMYEENPKFLSEVLGALLDETFSGSVGVQFAQQRHAGKGIPDGEITQEPFSILIETKLGNNFGKNQLLRHLEALKHKQGQKALLALGNSDQDELFHPDFLQIKELADKDHVAFSAVSFEQFLQALQIDGLSKNLSDAIADLRQYLDENNLLPSWKYRLDVVNCKLSFDSVLKHQIYTCPTRSGQYSHRRSLYFGTYRTKQVERIAQIEAVVDLESESEDEAVLVWKNVAQSDTELIEIAKQRRQQTGDTWYPVRVFVLSDLHRTHFTKTSPGGMFGNKQYFDVRHLKANDANDLAEKLKGKTWETY